MKKCFCLSLLFLTVLSFSGCNYRNDKIIAKRIQNMEKSSGNPGKIEDIQKSIREYDKDAQELVRKNGQIGIWYKILGCRYIDKKMYGEALQSFQKALEFYPDNENLYYYVGVCAGFLSHSALDFNASDNFEKKENYLRLSEASYKRAIEIYEKYSNAHRGLGCLYLFEMEEPEKAAECFEKALTIETKDTDLMMYLAQAYYMSYRFDDAEKIYDQVIATTKSAQKKALAEANKKVVLDASYGN